MNLKEVADKLGLSICTLKAHFPRTQENLLKKGIILTKEGYGKNAVFRIEYKR